MEEAQIWAPEVKVSSDGSRVAVVLPDPKGAEISLESVLAALEALQIKTPVDTEVIRQAIVTESWGQPITVSTAIQPIHGIDSSITYMFAHDRDAKPHELRDGRVDYKIQDTIRNVRAGELLAVRNPAVPGTDGMKVTGEAIPARAGRTLPMPAGKNTTTDSDGSSLHAAVNGQATLAKDGAVHVHTVYSVEGDVNMATGHIDFLGSVVVQGNVAPGFNITAEGNVDIKGFCSADLVVAGNHVMVGKGIQGRGKGVIKASGNLSALFIENATVVCGGSVTVRDAIMHSKISSGARVDVSKGKGVIVGGTIRASEEVRARSIGSQLATPTEIEVGIDPVLRERHAYLMREVEAKESELERVDQAIRVLQSKAGVQGIASLDPDKKAALLKLLRHRVSLADELAPLRTEMDNAEAQLKEAKSGKVVCTVLFPRVRVSVGQATLHTSDEWYNVVLYRGDDGKVGISSR